MELECAFDVVRKILMEFIWYDLDLDGLKY
jgi:hypothetical protein